MANEQYKPGEEHEMSDNLGQANESGERREAGRHDAAQA